MNHTPLEPEDRYGASDETLADDDVAQAPPEARVWLAQQRFVHGLLRALHTADAGTREGRVDNVMRRLRTPTPWRSWALAAAVLIAGTAAIWALWIDPTRLPRAEAMVARAIAALDQPIDREFELTIDLERGERHRQRQLSITLRPGRRFLVQGEGAFGRFRLGCDGATVWFSPAVAALRTEVPLADARRLTERLGEILDLGYLDLETLLRRLPATALRCVAREPDGVRLEAIDAVTWRHLHVHTLQMVVDDRSGLLRVVDAIASAEGRTRELAAHLRYRHVRDADLGEAAYRRPW